MILKTTGTGVRGAKKDSHLHSNTDSFELPALAVGEQKGFTSTIKSSELPALAVAEQKGFTSTLQYA